MEKIVAVDRNMHGEIISFQTSSGRVISFRKALEEMAAGTLEPVFSTPISSGSLTNLTGLDMELFDSYPPIY